LSPSHKKKLKKKKPAASNDISEREIAIFINSIKNVDGYPKIRDLQKIVPSLNLLKIHTILKYLERSNRLIVDNDGYIIWIKEDSFNKFSNSFSDVANISKDFAEYVALRKMDPNDN
jgi:hypothetical protein